MSKVNVGMFVVQAMSLHHLSTPGTAGGGMVYLRISRAKQVVEKSSEVCTTAKIPGSDSSVFTTLARCFPFAVIVWAQLFLSSPACGALNLRHSLKTYWPNSRDIKILAIFVIGQNGLNAT